MTRLLLLALLATPIADGPAKTDKALPYRTDSANAHLPWYSLKPGEFPPRGSEHVVDGELVEADFIHRSGQMRIKDTGKLLDFTLLPFAAVMHLDAEADLRDVPLGTFCQFFCYQDERGDFTKVAAMRAALPSDAPAGREARKLATEGQRKRHHAFLKERGLAAQIDRVEGKKLTVTLFGNPADLQDLLKTEGIDPARWAAEHRGVDAVVANDELRTYNPPVDRKRATVLEYQAVPTDAHGCGGVRWVIEPDLLLEGFRKGRVIRLFAHPSWPVNDMAFGESLYSEVPNVRAGVEEPAHYSYRTDFANEHLPWYRLKPGEFPPLQSHHLVAGQLVKVDVAHRSGQFRTDRTGELVDFTMPPFGTVMLLDAEADVRDLAIGTRYRFSLHQEDRGAFTKAAVITDEFTKLAGDGLSYRLDAVDLKKGELLLSWRHAPIKNDKEEMIQPPDLGRGVFYVDADTRVWRGDKRIAPGDLAVGDALLVNGSGQTATRRGVCRDVWVGLATHKLATETQRARHATYVKQNGLPAWIESVEGKSLTIAFFSGRRGDFLSLLNKDVGGEGAHVVLADEALRPIAAPAAKMRVNSQLLEGVYELGAGGTYGSSGMRWVIEADKPDERYRAGRVIRVFREGWPIRDKLVDDDAADR